MRPIILFLSLFVIFNSQLALAEDDLESLVKYRQYMMKIISNHYKSLKLLSVGRVNRPEQWLPHAQGLNNLAKMIVTVYPEGTFSNKSDAKEAIWSNKEDFNQKAEALVEHTEKLVSLIEQGQQKQTGQLFREISQTCKSCHKHYREK